jgi:deoxyribonuclease IV
LNDSKKELGSRVDRHEHIGLGTIGLDGFRPFVRDGI